MEIVSVEESSEARKKLEDPTSWIAKAGSHRSWLKALSTVLLDSGGVKSEALLLSRPLCMVRTWMPSQIGPQQQLKLSQAHLVKNIELLLFGFTALTSLLPLQVWVDCCQRLLPLIIHSILQQDSDGSWRELLSSHIQEFFRCCCRAQASNRSTAGVPPNCDSGESGAGGLNQAPAP